MDKKLEKSESGSWTGKDMVEFFVRAWWKCYWLGLRVVGWWGREGWYRLLGEVMLDVEVA